MSFECQTGYNGTNRGRASAQLRATLITLFLTRFTLSEPEKAALTSREVAVGQSVFDALDRVEQIRSDCRALLAGEEEKMQAGYATYSQYWKSSDAIGLTLWLLHRTRWKWATRKFTDGANSNLGNSQGKLSWKYRPSCVKLFFVFVPGRLFSCELCTLKTFRQLLTFSDAMQTLTSTRQSSLLSSFLDALTRGGPNGLPRPIELHAHDPTRYVGDMLAWVHQTTASEHEFLEGLFGVREKKRMVGSTREPVELDQEEQLVRDTLDRDLEGLGRPLKVSSQIPLRGSRN